MSADAILKDAKKRMDGAIEACKRDFQGIRTMRANPALLENVTADVYGSKMPLNQIATVSAPEARLLVVQVWDKANAAAVEKAINTADLGLNPAADGQMIRVPLPELTQERRKELAKVAQKEAEKARVSVRNVRRDAMDSLKKLEKGGDISEDELRAYSDDVQKATDAHIGDIDDLLAKKEKEILN